MIAEALFKLLVYGGFIAAGALLYFVGNLVFGFQKSGGKRLIVFIFGVGVGLLSVGAAFIACKADSSAAIGFIVILSLFAAGLGSLGAYLIGVSFFASSQTLEKTFEAVLRGF